MMTADMLPDFRPWSIAAVRLLQGVVYSDDARTWELVLSNQSPLATYFGRLGLLLVVDEPEGLAYLRQLTESELPPEYEPVPRLFRKTRLGYDPTLLCVLLREELRRYEEEDVHNERCVVEAAALFEGWKTFFPPQQDEVKQRKDFSAALSKLEDLGFVRRFSEQPEAWEIRRILKARLPVAELEGLQAQLLAAAASRGNRIKQLDRALEQTLNRQRQLQNEIDQAGGQHLRDIPLLIKEQQAYAVAKQQAAQRYERGLRQAGINDDVRDTAQFLATRQLLAQIVAEAETQLAASDAGRNDLLVEIAAAACSLGDLERELDSLRSRQSNLPDALAELRHRLCHDLGLKEKALPFVAELLAVKSEERKWESAIEKVLRTFALSLLVPERNYMLVSRYVERTRLAGGDGRGQRLVYLKVGQRRPQPVQPALHPQSLLSKLRFRDGAPFLP